MFNSALITAQGGLVWRSVVVLLFFIEHAADQPQQGQSSQEGQTVE